MLLRVVPTLLMVVVIGGCTQAPPVSTQTSADAEAEIRRVFTDFQNAVDRRDGARLWDLLADESRADAERKAKAIRAEFNQNNDGQRREEMAANFGVDQAELKSLDGKGYLKTNQFHRKWHAATDAKLDSIKASGTRGELVYVANDEDKHRVPMTLERMEGQWKLIIEMPR